MSTMENAKLTAEIKKAVEEKSEAIATLLEGLPDSVVSDIFNRVRWIRDGRIIYGLPPTNPQPSSADQPPASQAQ